MFWGYTPAVDLLREYFWWRGKARGQDPVEEAVTPPTGSVTVTEMTDHDDDDDGGQHEEGVERRGHVEEDDDSADDGGERVVGEQQLPQPDPGAGGRGVAPAGGQGRQDGGGGPAAVPSPGGQPGPVPLQDGPHHGRHVHLDGAVNLPGHQGLERDHAVCADSQGPRRLPTSATQDHPGDAGGGEEVTRTLSAAAGGETTVDPENPEKLAEDSVQDLIEKPVPVSVKNHVEDFVDNHIEEPVEDPLFKVEPKAPTGAEDTLDILLVGGLDCRHVLKTLSRLHCHAPALQAEGDRAPPRVRFFIAESVMELVARQLLLILAALEPPDRLGRTEKVRLILELLGNSLVRPSTALWVRNAARLLVDLVTNPAALRRRLPLVDLGQLRHQDRDRLEEVLAFYQERPQGFRVGYHWDQRLRRHLGVRYDTRAGAFDWDYFMALRDLPGGERVCVHEYRHWRETGVAFTWLEGEQSEPNVTLAAGIVREGTHLLHGGYLGDIVTSPYIAYSVELEPEDAATVFRKSNGQYVSRSTDAAERHLERIVHELQHREHYRPSPESGRGEGGIILTQVTDISRLDPEAPPDEEDHTLRRVRKAADMMSYEPLQVPGAEVVFLSPRFLQSPVEGRSRWAGRFQVAVLGLGLGEKHLDAALTRVLAPAGLVLVEGPRFLLQRPEARDQAAEAMRKRAQDAGLTPLQPFDPVKDDYAKFVLDGG